MSAKLQYSSKEESPGLHKQIGCMNGIFQLFDRNHFLANRRLNTHKHKRLPPPGPSGNHGMEPNYVTQKAKEKNLEDLKEKQAISVDSSRTSFSSSSWSSNFSSVDCNKSNQPETSFLTQIICPETATQMLPNRQQNPSLQLDQKFLGIRDFVKDSIYRETSGSSVNAPTQLDGIGHKGTYQLSVNTRSTERRVKHIDSPRPLHVSESVKPKVSSLDRSLPVLAKLREAPRSSNEEKAQALRPKDPPRFSYDESREKLKSSMKHKEFPRLSLDSRVQPVTSASESRANYLLDDIHRGNRNPGQALNPIEEPGSNKRPSSIVAKLMGLEALPDSMSTDGDQITNMNCHPDKYFEASFTLSRRADEIRHNQVSRSPRTPQREHASSQIRNINSVNKRNSRFPLEPAPWKQPDGNHGSQKSSFTNWESHKNAQNLCSSIYGEMERRLTELEFKRSGEDLRALKQILEAMEKTREKLENKRAGLAADLDPQTSYHGLTFHSLDQNSLSALQSPHQIIHPTPPRTKGTGPPKKFESSIMVIKPDKAVKKLRNSNSSEMSIEGIYGFRKIRISEEAENRKEMVKLTTKDLTTRNNHARETSCQALHSLNKSNNSRTNRSTEPAKAARQKMGSNPTNTRRGTTAGSPRLLQKKHETGKQSCQTTQISDSSRANNLFSKQQAQLGSPRRKIKPKSSKQGEDQLAAVRSETGHFSQQGSASSVQSESNISSAKSESNLSLASDTDTEVTSMYCPREMNCTYQLKDKKTEIAARLFEDRSKAEISLTLEQPSPISVLDMTFYREESPSPVKKKSTVFEDEETLSYGDAETNSVDLELLLNNTGLNLSPKFDQEKLMNSPHDEAAAEQVLSLCEITSPEHRYIAKILLASGLLLEDLHASLTLMQVPKSGYLVDPNLFLVLEQRKGSELSHDERDKGEGDESKFNTKIHRKLIFDTVNEILLHKLTSAGFSEPWMFLNKLGASSLTGKRLLGELCSEIDRLQAKNERSLHEEDSLISILTEDITYQTHKWADYHPEIPGMVLEIERLIFKDLINEVVSGEAAGLPCRSTKHCRRLFPNRI